MIRVLVDTNVLVSAAIALNRPQSKPAALLRQWQSGAFELVVCPAILIELSDLRHRPYFAKPGLAESLSRVITLLSELADVVPDGDPSGIEIRDPDDAVIVAAARSSGVDYLVTGDADLLVLKNFDVAIITPVSFLKILDAGRSMRSSEGTPAERQR